MTNAAERSARPDIRRIGVTVACLVMAVVAVGLRWTIINFDDFESYSAAVHRALAGQHLYTPLQLTGQYHLQELAGGNGFIYPPTAVVLLLPAGFGKAVGLFALVLGLAALAFVISELVKRELPEIGWIGLLIAGLVLLSPAAGDAIYVAQVTPFIAAGYGLAWLAPRASAWIGVIGALIKLFPFVLLVWAAKRRSGLLLPLVFGGLVISVTTIWLGSGTWLDYVTAWQNAEPQCGPPSLGSFSCALGSTGAMLGLLIAALLVAVSVVIPWRSLAFATIGLSSIVGAPDIFPNYLLIAIVAATPAVCRGARRLLVTQPSDPAIARG